MHANQCMLMKLSVATSTADGQLIYDHKITPNEPHTILLVGEQIVHVINLLFG